jgi:two-component system OmpR family response regulator
LHLVEDPIRVLLLDDDPENLLLRAAILRKHGYLTDTAGTIGEAEKLLNKIDIAVLDYHLGAGQFGTEVATILRGRRPEVPIIILSATLEHRFGGVEDMHLLKGYSSVDDLITALRSFEAKHRGKPVVVDARDFFYSRISMAIGEDVTGFPARTCSSRCLTWRPTGRRFFARSRRSAKRILIEPIVVC